MNTGQMLLVIGAFVLLSRLSISVMETTRVSDEQSLQVSRLTEAVDLCDAALEDLAFTAFDSLTVGDRVETTVTALAAYRCSSSVAYVTSSSLDNPVTGPTLLKRVSVCVSAEGDTVRMQAVSASF